MTAARQMHDASLPAASDSGVGLIQPRDEEAFLSMDDLVSLHPAQPPLQQPPLQQPPLQQPPLQQPQPELNVAPDLAIPDAEYAALSLESEGDDEIAQLMAQQKRGRLKGLAVCLAFPAVIGLVLFTISGEGHAKEDANPMLISPIAQGESIVTKVERDARELAAIRAELAAADEKSDEKKK